MLGLLPKPPSTFRRARSAERPGRGRRRSPGRRSSRGGRAGPPRSRRSTSPLRPRPPTRRRLRRGWREPRRRPAPRASPGCPSAFRARRARAVSRGSLAKSGPAPNPPSGFWAPRTRARRAARSAGEAARARAPRRDAPGSRGSPAAPPAARRSRARRRGGLPVRAPARGPPPRCLARASAGSRPAPSSPCCATSQARARWMSGTAARGAEDGEARLVSAQATPFVSAKKCAPNARRTRSTASRSSGEGSVPGAARNTKPSRNSFWERRWSGRRAPIAPTIWSIVIVLVPVADTTSPSRLMRWRSTAGFRRSVSGPTFSSGGSP